MKPVSSAIANAKHLTAYIDAGKDSLEGMDVGKVLVQFPDFAPEEALPYLAEQHNVQGYRGYLLATTEQQKRDLIKSATYLHKIAGTPFAIKRAILAVGFDSVVIREHTGIGYDGSFDFDGSHNYVGGSWFNFSVEVFYTGTAPDSDKIELVTKLIGEWKNERSLLFDLIFTET